MYESVCVPDLGDFLGYQSGAHQVATPEHKSPATPASSATSNSSGPQNTGNQPTAPLQPPSAAVSLPSRQYHNDGKCLSHFIYPLLQFPQKNKRTRLDSYRFTRRKIDDTASRGRNVKYIESNVHLRKHERRTFYLSVD